MMISIPHWYSEAASPLVCHLHNAIGAPPQACNVPLLHVKFTGYRCATSAWHGHSPSPLLLLHFNVILAHHAPYFMFISWRRSHKSDKINAYFETFHNIALTLNACPQFNFYAGYSKQRNRVQYASAAINAGSHCITAWSEPISISYCLRHTNRARGPLIYFLSAPRCSPHHEATTWIDIMPDIRSRHHAVSKCISSVDDYAQMSTYSLYIAFQALLLC